MHPIFVLHAAVVWCLEHHGQTRAVRTAATALLSLAVAHDLVLPRHPSPLYPLAPSVGLALEELSCSLPPGAQPLRDALATLDRLLSQLASAPPSAAPAEVSDGRLYAKLLPKVLEVAA